MQRVGYVWAVYGKDFEILANMFQICETVAQLIDVNFGALRKQISFNFIYFDC